MRKGLGLSPAILKRPRLSPECRDFDPFTTKTLGIMLTMAIIGVAIVLAHTMGIYWIFRGKVKLDRTSYSRSLGQRDQTVSVAPSAAAVAVGGRRFAEK
jgi:hypothetical protein